MMAFVNMYMQQMIKICSAHGGDVIKFAGDAIIVLWTGGPHQHVLLHRACECAVELRDALQNSTMAQTVRMGLKVRAVPIHDDRAAPSRASDTPGRVVPAPLRRTAHRTASAPAPPAVPTLPARTPARSA